jgi:hypothetical protein
MSHEYVMVGKEEFDRAIHAFLMRNVEAIGQGKEPHEIPVVLGNHPALAVPTPAVEKGEQPEQQPGGWEAGKVPTGLDIIHGIWPADDDGPILAGGKPGEAHWAIDETDMDKVVQAAYAAGAASERDRAEVLKQDGEAHQARTYKAEAETRTLAREAAEARLYLKGCLGHFFEETPLSTIAKDVTKEFHAGRLREQELRARADTLAAQLAESERRGEAIRAVELCPLDQFCECGGCHAVHRALSTPPPKPEKGEQADGQAGEVEKLAIELRDAANFTIPWETLNPMSKEGWLKAARHARHVLSRTQPTDTPARGGEGKA